MFYSQLGLSVDHRSLGKVDVCFTPLAWFCTIISFILFKMFTYILLPKQGIKYKK